jgi:DNA-binding FrmR family transcriptional regulator
VGLEFFGLDLNKNQAKKQQKILMYHIQASLIKSKSKQLQRQVINTTKPISSFNMPSITLLNQPIVSQDEEAALISVAHNTKTPAEFIRKCNEQATAQDASGESDYFDALKKAFGTGSDQVLEDVLQYYFQVEKKGASKEEHVDQIMGLFVTPRASKPVMIKKRRAAEFIRKCNEQAAAEEAVWKKEYLGALQKAFETGSEQVLEDTLQYYFEVEKKGTSKEEHVDQIMGLFVAPLANKSTMIKKRRDGASEFIRKCNEQAASEEAAGKSDYFVALKKAFETGSDQVLEDVLQHYFGVEKEGASKEELADQIMGLFVTPLSSKPTMIKKCRDEAAEFIRKCNEKAAADEAAGKSKYFDALRKAFGTGSEQGLENVLRYYFEVEQKGTGKEELVDQIMGLFVTPRRAPRA